MRITPLICWECKSWFIPKTKRPNKFCCGACRQQNYLKRKNGSGDIKHNNTGVIRFKWANKDEQIEIYYAMIKSCPEERPMCVEHLFENNYERYTELVMQYGIDKYGNNCRDFLNNSTAFE